MRDARRSPVTAAKEASPSTLLNIGESTTYEHYFYAPTKEDAQNLLGDLQRYGALTPEEVRPSASGDGEWLVMAYTDFLEDDDAKEEQADEFLRLAGLHHGEYDGGGMFVGKLGQMAPGPDPRGPLLADPPTAHFSPWARLKGKLFG